MKKLGLWPIIINPSARWNREYICDVCGHRTFIPAGKPLTAPWVRCIISNGRLECGDCHMKCLQYYTPNKVNGNNRQPTGPPRGKFGHLITEQGGQIESPE